MATDDPAALTPAAAVTRHIEWLEFALAAARDEETRRRERLAKASAKNRDKRTIRLAEVTAEVRELEALVQGLKSLQARPAAGLRRSTRRRSTSAKAKATTSRRAKPKPAAARRPKAAPPASSSAATSSAASAAPKATTTTGPAGGDDRQAEDRDDRQAEGRDDRQAEGRDEGQADQAQGSEARRAARTEATGSPGLIELRLAAGIPRASRRRCRSRFDVGPPPGGRHSQPSHQADRR